MPSCWLEGQPGSPWCATTWPATSIETPEVAFDPMEVVALGASLADREIALTLVLGGDGVVTTAFDEQS